MRDCREGQKESGDQEPVGRDASWTCHVHLSGMLGAMSAGALPLNSTNKSVTLGTLYMMTYIVLQRRVYGTST